MRRLRAWYLRFVGLFHKDRLDRDLALELESHLRLHVEDNLRSGMAPDEARRQALIKLGGIEQTKENYRERYRIPRLETFMQDVRFGLRMLRKNPGFAAIAILTLALGIGANTAIFTVVEAILLRPLPIRDPGRVVVLHDQLPEENIPRAPVSPPQFRAYSAHTKVFESTAAVLDKSFNLMEQGDPQRLRGMRATATLFPLLGMRPILGRTFTNLEDSVGGQRVVILSEGLWKSMFGGDHNVVGKLVHLDDQNYEVIGVLPEKLEILYPNAELWIPMAFSPRELAADAEWSLTVTMLARLRPGVTIEQARAVMNADADLVALSSRQMNFLKNFRIEVRPFTEDQVGDVREPLYLLVGAVLLVLLIACANVANLLLVRASARSREMAIRAAIGGRRSRVIAQLLTESLLLSVTGGALGILLAVVGIKVLTHFAPASLPHAALIRLDFPVLIFALVVSVLAGVFFGLAPAARTNEASLTDALKESSSAGFPTSNRHMLRFILLPGEFAVTFVLLVGSGLLLRSLANLVDVKEGFDPNNVLTMRIAPSQNVDRLHTIAYSTALLSRISELPNVRQAALAFNPPLFPEHNNNLFAIRDYRPGPNEPLPDADIAFASPGYFAAMGIPLLRGRVYSLAEMVTGGPEQNGALVIIDEALAKHYWPNINPIGQQLSLDRRGPWATIVGVVGTVRNSELSTESRGMIYFGSFLPGMTLVIRTVSDPRTLAETLRLHVQSLDSTQAVYDVKTMGQRVAESVEQKRFAATLLTLFAALALALAAVGLYSVMAYIVSQRTHEIGIRMAVGAQPGDVLQLIIGAGAKLALSGLCVGIFGALTLSPLLRSQLFGIGPFDPLTFFGVSIILIVMVLLACFIPAWRAMQVDPMVALRYE